MPTHVNALPYEVLEGIFCYLENLQRLEAALVCKHWAEVLNHKTFLKDFYLQIDQSIYINHLPELLTPTRKFGHYKFEDVKLDRNFFQLMKSNYNSIHTLSFKSYWNDEGGDFGDEESIPLDKLRCLNIEDSVDVLDLISSMSNLEELVVNDEDMKDFHLKKLQDITSKLKKIHFSADIICSEDNSLFTIAYPDRDITLNSPSAEILSVPFIVSLITQHSTTLEDLYMAHFPPSTLLTIASIPGLRLKKFAFPCDCEPSLAVEFCRLQPSLISIAFLDEFLILEPSHWTEIVRLLPHLQGISLCGIDSTDLKTFFQLKALKELFVSECTLNESVPTSLAWTYLRKFKSYRFSSDPLIKFLPSIRYIQYLDLENSVTNEVMWMISATLTDLKSLRLGVSADLTDEGLTGEMLPEEPSTFIPVPISNLKRLIKLQIQHIINFTEEGVIKAIRFPSLINLEILDCDINESIRPTFFKENPCLRKCIIKNVFQSV